jgi:hypothetical protein
MLTVADVRDALVKGYSIRAAMGLKRLCASLYA